MFSNALCSVFFCHVLFCLAITKSVVVSGVSDKSVLNVVDAAFRQEAYLNEQISNSLHASDFTSASKTQMPGMPPSFDPPSDPSIPSASEAEPGLASDPPSSVAVLPQLQSSEEATLVSSEASNRMRFLQASTQSLKAPSSLPSQEAQTPSEEGHSSQLGRSSLHLASVDQHISTSADADIRSLRPGAGSGVADTVAFGVFAKALYAVNLKNNKFTMDAVLALKWNDPRAAGLVPPGMDEVSMSAKEALAKIWMPEVVITNRDIGKVDVISTAVTISNAGVVSKVERSIVVCNNVYELEEYPFDKQQLTIKIASSKYMLNHLVLRPDVDKSSSGKTDGIMSATEYTMDSWRVFAFDETDGALKKSRGVLELSVERKFGGYFENHLKPSFLFLAISWGVFWFPFENPFITPRLALSVLVLVAFTNLLIKSTAALPQGAPYNWNDLFNLQIQSMMFLTIVLNIFSETCKHKLKLDALAIGINNEAKGVLPCLSILLMTIVLTAGSLKWLSLSMAGIVTNVLLVVVVGIYIAHNAARVSSHTDERIQLEIQAKELADRIEAEKQLEK